ncbi:phosphatidate cytidylyltransferase [Haliangium sp.]|uniref:phosphatidate cytidylyltransferase n=1 Tax=Haliangium sp. TaxID=2663208 RepID=UPI003D0D73AE
MAKLGNLASRLLVAAVAAPVLVFIFYLDNPLYTWLLLFAATFLALHEFFGMTLSDPADRRASLICSMLAAATLYWWDPSILAIKTHNFAFAGAGPTMALFLAVIPISLYYLFRVGDMNTVATRMAYSVLGAVYVGLLITFLGLIKRDFGPAGGDLLVFLLIVAWMGDTGAYFGGRFFGKRKLYPTVSPGKTWAGAIGGLLVSVASAAGVKLGLSAVHDPPSIMHQLTWLDILALSVPGAILGQLGDLVESLLKRSTGVKDSGSLLPGHGGILDRVDAVLVLAPYVYLYLIVRGAL